MPGLCTQNPAPSTPRGLVGTECWGGLGKHVWWGWGGNRERSDANQKEARYKWKRDGVKDQ